MLKIIHFLPGLLCLIFHGNFLSSQSATAYPPAVEEARKALMVDQPEQVLDLLENLPAKVDEPSELADFVCLLKTQAYFLLKQDSLAKAEVASLLNRPEPASSSADNLAILTRVKAQLALRDNQNASATKLYWHALDYYEDGRATDTSEWLVTLALLANKLYENSEVQRAIETSWIAAELADQNQSLPPEQRFRTTLDAAIIHYRTDKFEDGLVLANKCIALAKLTDDPGNRMAAIHERSLMYGGLGRLAEQAEDQKMLIAANQPGIRGKVRQAISRHSLANNYVKRDLFAEAVEQEQLALPVFREYLPSALSRVSIVLASALKELGQIEEALTVVNDGLRSTPRADLLYEVNGLPTVVVDSVQEFTVVRILLNTRAGILFQAGRYAEAESDLATIEALTDLRRQSAKLNSSQFFLSALSRPLYDNYLRLYRSLGRHATMEEKEIYAWRALQKSDLGKAYSLAAALGDDRYDLREEERRLRYDISRLERQVVSDTSRRGELAELRLALSELRDTTPTGGTTQLNLDQDAVDQLLSDQQSELLAYHIAEDTTFILHYRPGVAQLLVQQTPANLNDLITAWRATIVNGGSRSPNLQPKSSRLSFDEAFLKNGLQLHRYLFPEALELGPRLLIIPDGLLNYLPFTALPMDSSSLPLDYQQLNYFGDGHEISYAQSVSVLLAQSDLDKRDSQGNILAIAPSFNAGENNTEQTLANREQTQGSMTAQSGEIYQRLRPLLHNLTEVELLSERLDNCSTLIGAAASKTQFVKRLEATDGPPAIVHLASHGLANVKNPNLSYVAFTPVDGGDSEDNLLYYNELSLLPLHSEMVVLSACETNLGPVLPGEGVLSMASAFAAAGARSTVTTLWPVEDRAIQLLMEDFYMSLVEGLDRRAALHQASKELRNNPEYAHPKYWAGVTLHGSAGKIDLRANGFSRHYWWLGLIATGLLAGLYFLFFRKNA